MQGKCKAKVRKSKAKKARQKRKAKNKAKTQGQKSKAKKVRQKQGVEWRTGAQHDPVRTSGALALLVDDTTKLMFFCSSLEVTTGYSVRTILL